MTTSQLETEDIVHARKILDQRVTIFFQRLRTSRFKFHHLIECDGQQLVEV